MLTAGAGMASEIKMPPLGEGIESAEVLEVRTAPGESVNAGQVLIVVQSEKVAVELEAPQPGRVVKFLVKEGDTLQVGQPYCLFETNGEAPTAPAAKPAKAEAKAAVPPPMPRKEPPP